MREREIARGYVCEREACSHTNPDAGRDILAEEEEGQPTLPEAAQVSHEERAAETLNPNSQTLNPSLQCRP